MTIKSKSDAAEMLLSNADLKGTKILFIAYFYPPVTSTGVPGAMRTIKFIRNLRNGEFHVLTRMPNIRAENSALRHLTLPVNREQIHSVASRDIFALLLSLREKLKSRGQIGLSNSPYAASNKPVFRSSDSEQTPTHGWQKLKDFIYNLCYFPDSAGPWILPAFLRGRKLVREKNIDIIFATGSPWSALVTGLLISKATGKPLIVDFRDPWTNNPFLPSKGKRLDNWSIALEAKIVEHAAAVSLNTAPLRDEFIARYPHIAKDHFFVMPNGFDDADFRDISSIADNRTTDNTLTLCHTGFLYGVRDPAVLLNAIKIANKRLAASDKRVQFIQIGEIQLAYDIRERYGEMITDGSLVLQPTCSYQECLQALKKADWVVNVQPGTKSQIPSKLYDYLAINRPILNITPVDGALGTLVTMHNLGKLFGFDDEGALSEELIDMALHRESWHPFPGYEARPKFDYAVIAEHLAAKINRITGGQA